MQLFVRLFLLVISILLLGTSCRKDEAFTDLPLNSSAGTYPEVPAALWDYFERFEIAAQENGRSVDLTALNISAEIRELTEDGVAGTCTYGSHEPGHVVIDQTFWERSSDLLKEMIIFHELGHCVLRRDHWEGTLANGACESIMRSGLGDCRDNYRTTTRDVYLEELFGRNQ